MDIVSFKNFISPEVFLTESFSEGVYVRDLKDYMNLHDGQLNGFSVSLSNGQTFSFTKAMLNKIQEIVSGLPDSFLDSPLFSIDAKNKKFKISRKRASLFDISIPEIKKLDSKFSGFGEGSISKFKGSNKGDITEILFALLVYVYILEQGDIQGMDAKFFDLIDSVKELTDGSKLDIYSKIDLLKVNLSLGMKNKELLSSYLQDPDSRSELQEAIQPIIHFISSQPGSWKTIIQNIQGKVYTSDTTITILGSGNKDTKLEKTDISITVKESSKKEELEDLISIKDQNVTYARIELTSLTSLKENLSYLGIVLSDSEEKSIKSAIAKINSEIYSVAESGKKHDEVKIDLLGYNLSRTVFDIIKNHFDASTPKQKLENFILAPANFFIKGTDSLVHNKSMTVVDLFKKTMSVIKPKFNFDAVISKQSIISPIAKHLSMKYIFSTRKSRPNNLSIFFGEEELIRLRYSVRDFSKLKPRFQIYVDVMSTKLLEEILEKLIYSVT